MVQSSLATKSQSFDLVKSEIEQTIRQAESSLERFQENRESGEDLQNCVDFLNQLRGIFILVELRAGTLLCQEAVSMANDVPVMLNTIISNVRTIRSCCCRLSMICAKPARKNPTRNPVSSMLMSRNGRTSARGFLFRRLTVTKRNTRYWPAVCV